MCNVLNTAQRKVVIYGLDACVDLEFANGSVVYGKVCVLVSCDEEGRHYMEVLNKIAKWLHKHKTCCLAVRSYCVEFYDVFFIS